MSKDRLQQYNMAQSATVSRKTLCISTLSGESNYHTTSCVGEVDPTMETRVASKRGNRTRSSSQRIPTRSHITTLCMRNRWKTARKQPNATERFEKATKGDVAKPMQKKLDEIRLLCGYKFFDICNQKATLLLYLEQKAAGSSKANTYSSILKKN